MKIRFAIKSNFLSRKIRGAAYGLLLLLTFFVPQFAKTQDQLNAARLAKSDAGVGAALERNQVRMPADKSQEAYAEQTAYIASLSQAVLPAEVEPAREEAVRFSPAPVMYAEEAVQPVLVASLTPTIIPAVVVPAMEIVRISPTLIKIETVNRVVDPAAAQTVQVASLSRAFLPAAVQSTTDPELRFTGEYISVDLVNIPLVDFFRVMADVGGVNIVLDPTISGNIAALKVEKLPWDQLFEVVLRNHGLDKSIEGNMIRVARKATLQEEARQEEELRRANMMAGELDTRIKRLNYAKAAELQNIVSDQKTARGTVAVDERSNSLLITDLPDSLEKLLKLIDSFDTPQPQVEIETRIVTASRNFARDIGIQFGFVQGNSQRVTVGGSNSAFLQPGTGNANRPMGESSSSSDSPGVSPGTGDTGGNLNVNLPALNPFGGIGLAVGNIFDTFLLDAAITAGESKGTAKIVQQPKVIVQNNSPAVITNGSRIPVTVNSDNTITVQFFDAALKLTVTPQITYDSNIMLDVDVANNEPNFGRASMNGVPTITTSEAKTRILVSDGGTAVLGGVIKEEDQKNETRIPGLASLPILGNLFKSTSTIRTTDEILFFITPRILN